MTTIESQAQVVIFEDDLEAPFVEQDPNFRVPAGWEADWLTGNVGGHDRQRPESQPNPDQVYTGKQSAKLSHAYGIFDGAYHKTVEIPFSIGTPLALEAMVRYESRHKDPSIWGGFGLVLGLDPTGGTDMRSATVSWGQWRSQDEPGAGPVLEGWARAAVMTVSQGPFVTLFLRAACRHPVEVNAGMIDRVSLAATVESPDPGPVDPRVLEMLVQIDSKVNGLVAQVGQVHDWAMYQANYPGPKIQKALKG